MRKLFGSATADIKATEFGENPKQPHKPQCLWTHGSRGQGFTITVKGWTSQGSVGGGATVASVRIPSRGLVSSPGEEKVTGRMLLKVFTQESCRNVILRVDQESHHHRVEIKGVNTPWKIYVGIRLGLPFRVLNLKTRILKRATHPCR